MPLLPMSPWARLTLRQTSANLDQALSSTLPRSRVLAARRRRGPELDRRRRGRRAPRPLYRDPQVQAQPERPRRHRLHLRREPARRRQLVPRARAQSGHDHVGSARHRRLSRAASEASRMAQASVSLLAVRPLPCYCLPPPRRNGLPHITGLRRSECAPSPPRRGGLSRGGYANAGPAVRDLAGGGGGAARRTPL